MLDRCIISGFADEIDPMLDVQIDLLKKLGQDHLVLRAADGKGVLAITNDEMREIRKRLDAAGIRVSSLGSPIGKIGILDDFEPHFEAFQHAVELAEILGTRNIRMFSFYIPKDEDPAKYRDEVLRRLRILRDYAAEKGIVLLHENEKGIYGDNALRCLDLFRELGNDHFKCIFDFANFIQCGQETMEAYEMLKDYIVYIHVKDALSENGRVVPAGEGDGRLAEIFEKLNAAGFDGFLSLEPHLAEFMSLKELEAPRGDKKLSDGIEAYTIAHTALVKLLGRD